MYFLIEAPALVTDITHISKPILIQTSPLGIHKP